MQAELAKVDKYTSWTVELKIQYQISELLARLYPRYN